MQYYSNPTEEILEKAIETFKQSFSISVSTSKKIGENSETNIEIVFDINNNNFAKKYLLEINKPTEAVIGQLVLKKNQFTNKTLFVTDYISPKTADKLRDLDISFLDSSGNAFFNEPEFYVFISSRVKEKISFNNKRNLIFQTSGLRLLFVLLSIPDSENKTYRELAGLSGISLGSVNAILSNLQREFYLIKKNDKRLLVRKDELLKRWVQVYAEILRPNLRKSFFQPNEKDWQNKVNLTNINALWGGEMAGKNLTDFLKPAKFTIYTDDYSETVKHLQKKGLRRDYNGQVEVLEVFWNFTNDSINVPPLLIYADLVASADSRNLEVAKMIYDEHLARLVE